MNADDRVAKVEQLLEWSASDDIPSGMAEYRLACAQVQATLLLAAELRQIGPWIKEVGDQLDTMPRAPRSIVPQPFTAEQVTEAVNKIWRESFNSRDLTTRRKLTEALAVIAPSIGHEEMATTGRIPDSESTS